MGLSPGSDGPLGALTSDEVTSRLQELRSELDLQANLMLLSAFEAEVFRAFETVVAKPLRRRIAHRLDRTARRPALDDVLDAWKSAAGIRSRAVGEFRQLLDLRHWLAHGRRWSLDRCGVRYASPRLVYERGEALLVALGVAGRS